MSADLAGDDVERIDGSCIGDRDYSGRVCSLLEDVDAAAAGRVRAFIEDDRDDLSVRDVRETLKRAPVALRTSTNGNPSLTRWSESARWDHFNRLEDADLARDLGRPQAATWSIDQDDLDDRIEDQVRRNELDLVPLEDVRACWEQAASPDDVRVIGGDERGRRHVLDRREDVVFALEDGEVVNEQPLDPDRIDDDQIRTSEDVLDRYLEFVDQLEGWAYLTHGGSYSLAAGNGGGRR